MTQWAQTLLIVHIESEFIYEICQSPNGNCVLGNKRFKEEITNMLKRRITPGNAGRATKESVN